MRRGLWQWASPVGCSLTGYSRGPITITGDDNMASNRHNRNREPRWSLQGFGRMGWGTQLRNRIAAAAITEFGLDDSPEIRDILAGDDGRARVTAEKLLREIFIPEAEAAVAEDIRPCDAWRTVNEVEASVREGTFEIRRQQPRRQERRAETPVADDRARTLTPTEGEISEGEGEAARVTAEAA